MTLHTDVLGQDVTLIDPSAVADWDNTVEAFLAHGAATPEHLGETLRKAPEFALAWAAKGMFYLLLGRAELVPVAKEALQAAKTSAASTPPTVREAAYIRALELYLAGQMRAASDTIAAILIDHPSDSLAMKLVQGIRFVLGDRAGMLSSISSVLPAFGDDHPHRGYARGCMAFALEETGDYGGAERHGRAGLEVSPDDAWGLHAVAHVYDMTARNEKGIQWLETQTGSWTHCNNFGFHVWWHLALFYLDQGDFDHVLALYDEKIRSEHTDDYRDISNAASMLVRLEIEGVDIGTRWDELAALSANRVDDAAVIFADLHYLLALNGGQRDADADRLLIRMAKQAQRSDHDMHEVAAVAGVPAAMGLAAFRAGDYALAHLHLRDCQSDMQCIGGSHAQRDVFQRLMIEAAIRNGDWTGAEHALGQRTLARGAEDGFTMRRREAVSRRRDAALAAE